jgi:hypothetical protein
MYTLQSDEKATQIMVYSHDKLVRGELVTKDTMMVSRLMRTPAAPIFFHLLKANVVSLVGGAPRVNNFAELYFPTSQCLAYHMTPPRQDALDYEAGEQNRLMLPVSLLAGSFLLQGKLRVSAQLDLTSTLEGMRTPWLSLYEITITHPTLPQLRLEVPMALVEATRVSYGFE